jgi:hypothetical protein
MTNNPIGLLQPSLKRIWRQDRMKDEKIKGNLKDKIILNFILITPAIIPCGIFICS